MKRNFFLRLCLMIIALLSLHSCRQDILQEHETYHNTSAFQLKSNRISLNEAKHKAKLVSEIEQVETKFKSFSKTNAQGKVINYGNGISIDTDNVTYIENGSNFHTYTFNITRDNALPNDPVENLVLVPMTNGNYKELLVTYNLTPEEKQILLNGGFVDTKGKTEVIEISTGNQSALLGKGQSCAFETTTYYMSCTSGDHMPGEDGCQLSGDDRAKIYTVTNYVCTNIYDGTETGGGESVPGGTDSGTGGEPLGPGTTEPCNGSGVSTNPLDPNTNIGEGGCSGIPTVVTVPNLKNMTPCEVLKENEQNQTLVSKRDSLKTLVTKTNPDTHETLVVVTKENGNLIYNTYVKPSSSPGLTSVSGTGTNNDIADMHNHPPGHIPIYSFADIVTLYDSYKFLFPGRKKVFISYLVNFNGTMYALKMNDPTALDALFDGMNIGTATTTPEQKEKARTEVKRIFKKHGMDDSPYSQARAEKLFMNVINDSEIGAGNGIHIYRKDTDGWGKLNANGNITKENCPL